jgi:dihydrofolate synthase/folylpolyglutamate synthase
MNITRYKDIEAFLFKQLPMFQRVGPKAFKTDLKNIEYLDALVGHPHRHFKSIHIAGTNGKGSTSFFIAALLAAAGYKVGLYTSPHYKSYRERIKVDGQMIPKRVVKSFVNDLIAQGVFDLEEKPSFFEITVAMAFAHFRDEQVDYAIIETGLGGRLDSTNVITPILSVITNIGYDHMNFLGTTLPEIAGEKAGIIKKGIPVVIGRKQKETTTVFAHKAEATQSRLRYAESNLVPSSILQLFPDYQKENLNLAMTALDEMDVSIAPNRIKDALTLGLARWGYMGRFQRINVDPTIIADSAHNEMGISTLFNEIKKLAYRKLHIVIAVVSDKDLGLVFPYFPKDAKYYFAAAKIPRAMNAKTLSDEAAQSELYGKAYPSVPRALAAAKLSARKDDLILVTGSIFTVAEVV